jgi:hypothetical protein
MAIAFSLTVCSMGIDFLDAGRYDKQPRMKNTVLYKPAKPSLLLEKF